MHAADEFSLLFFTLLCQLGVGIVLASIVALYKNETIPETGRIRSQGVFALVCVAVAALISCLHLGTPLHAPYTIFNIGSSWLSREIFLVLLTLASLCCMVYFWHKKPEASTGKIFAIISACIGILLLYAMSRVYQSPFLPGWDHSSTFFLFLASALILGSIWQGIAIAISGKGQHAPLLWRVLFLAITGFALIAIFAPISLPDAVAMLNPASVESSQGQISVMQAAHACLAAIGIIFFCWAVRRSVLKETAGGLLMASFIFAFAGEVIGRYAFYMSYARLGM